MDNIIETEINQYAVQINKSIKDLSSFICKLSLFSTIESQFLLIKAQIL